MPSMIELQQLVKLYHLTNTGSKPEIAKRIYSLRSLYLSDKNRKMLEDYLHIPTNKKETRPRKTLPT